MSRRKIILDKGEEIVLSEKEILFADYYLANGFNATAAAIKAGYSANSAKVQASRMLTNVNLSKYLNWKSKPILEELEITQERIIREMAAIAFARPTDFLNPDLTIKSLDEMKREMLPAIKQIEKTDRGFKVIFHDKIASLSRLSDLIQDQNNEAQSKRRGNLFSSINEYLSKA
jgi:phage terminase small subunit